MNRAARFARRPALIALALAGLAASASGYYHFLHFTTIDGALRGVPEKFDVSVLHDKTLFFYVSDQGPANLAAGDSFASLLSQVRLAAKTWDSVSTSDLRLSYGGLFARGTAQNTPHMEVVFDELPPGVLAMAAPVTTAGITAGPNPFVPVAYSVMQLNKDLSQQDQASYRNWSFLVILHEMGHALGLQHSAASSAMSTLPTRTTSRSKPLGDDDIAGLSALYPNALYAKRLGSLSGRVTMDGNGLHMASVVALTPTGEAIGTLTNPDGAYRIEGLPPRQYYLYVQPLPPATQPDLGPADIELPLDADGHPIPAGPTFKTQFYPGTVNMVEALSVLVPAGGAVTDVNFAVQAGPAPSINEVRTYTYNGDVVVKPAYVNMNNLEAWYLVAGGAGLIENGAARPGLTVSVMGGTSVVKGANVADWDPNFLKVDFLFNLFSGTGPRHLLFSTPDELYVLPSGLQQVTDPPPSIASATPGLDANGNPVVTLAGADLLPTTRILFDGVEAVASYNGDQHQIVVTPPLAPSKHEAAIIALNPDGQVSSFIEAEPAHYTYPETPAPSFTLTPAALPAGVESMIEIEGINTNFAQGRTSVGFGTSDIVVKRVWVLSPTKLRASVAVARPASALTTLATITTDLQTIVQPAIFQMQAANPTAASISSDLVNPNGRATVYIGSLAIVQVSNLPLDPGSIFATLNDVPATVASVDAAAKQIVIVIPQNLTPGMAVLRIQAAGVQAPPVVVSIDLAPPVVVTALDGTTPLAPGTAIAPGETITLQVANVPDAAAIKDPARFQITIGNVEHVPNGDPAAVEGQANQYLISFIVSPLLPAGEQVPLTVTVDGRTSDVYQVLMK